jgi:hypothetical protein
LLGIRDVQAANRCDTGIGQDISQMLIDLWELSEWCRTAPVLPDTFGGLR